MRLLQINAVYGYASTGTISKDIGDVAMQCGMQSYIACQRSSLSDDQIYCVGNILDWKLHALLTRLTGRQAFFSKRPTKRLLRWMEEINPDIVHLHNVHSNFVNLQLICNYCRQKDIPLVLTLHDCWFFTGKCTHFVKTGCDRWKTGCGNCSQLKMEVPCLLGDPTAKVFREKLDALNSVPKLYVVGCSQWITDCAKKSQLKAKEFFTIPNGVDTNVFTPRESKFAKKYHLENKFVILGMANKWTDPANKDGVEQLLKELDSDCRIVIVGCDETKKAFFAPYPNVISVPFVKDPRELADIYNAADVFVNLTRADTLPTVNMESICCGTPVITFDVCGSPELVDVDCGIVIPEGDFGALIDAITQLKEMFLAYDVQSKQILFNKDTSYLQYIRLYESISNIKA